MSQGPLDHLPLAWDEREWYRTTMLLTQFRAGRSNILRICGHDSLPSGNSDVCDNRLSHQYEVYRWRKEMAIFFYLYMLTMVLEMLLVSGIISPAVAVYPWLVAGHVGLVCTSIWSLFLNGFVGFQFMEDNTSLSLWTMRLTSLTVFGVAYFISIGTSESISSFLSPTMSFPLWMMYFVFNGAAILIYFILQIILIFKKLDDRWPLGDILFSMGFFMIGQAALYLFSGQICAYTNHYIDGIFFGVLCSLFSVMMIYKYWDSITKEDLEFSVSSHNTNWDVKTDRKEYP
ncbi:Chitin synthase, class 7 [Basidiobolus ranarum]|uniref:Chitin synthase export chaperone n=1 Tax=Basidiobolus ranarum TaxID=34480 RepID=A0ABR2WWH7_9FUNG